MKRIAIVSACVLSVAALSAQQAGQAGAAGQAGRGRGQATAPPPINWPSPPLPDGPINIDTGLVRPVKITVTKGLTQPWSMAFLPDGTMLVTERPGRLRMIRDGALDPKPLTGVPHVRADGLQGLMDVVLHPRFAENKWIYLSYHRPVGNPPTAGETVLARGT